MQWTKGRTGNFPSRSSNRSNAHSNNGILLKYRMEQSPAPSINLTFRAALLGSKFTPFQMGKPRLRGLIICLNMYSQ